MGLKRHIIEGLHRTGALGLARMVNRRAFQGATVILYHRVLPDGTPPDHYVAQLGDPTQSQLESLIRYLRRWFRFSTPLECLERWRQGKEIDPYTLLLTFDDGYADMYELLLPVLRKCQVPATVFVTTGGPNGYVTWAQRMFSAMEQTTRSELPSFNGLDRLSLGTAQLKVAAIESISALQKHHAASEWEGMITRLCEGLGWDGTIEGERMMTWTQVEGLHRSGLVTIGGHTATHPMLETCDPEQRKRELFEPAEELKSRLGTDFLPFSYPQGRRPPPELEALVREAGYNCAFTGRWEPNTLKTPMYRLGREHIPPDDVARASLLLSGLKSKGAPHGGNGAGVALT